MNIKRIYNLLHISISNRVHESLRIRMISSFKYDEVGDFHEGLAKVRFNQKWGYINEFGVEVIDFQYDDAGDFCMGRAKVNSKGKWGFVNKSGQVRVSFMYDEVSNFSYGASKVKQLNKRTFIDRNGNQISSINLGNDGRFHLIFRLFELITKKKNQFTQLSNNINNYQVSKISKNGLRWATIDGSHYGYVDNTGKLRIKMQYDKVYDFNENRALVKLNGKYGFINKNNKRTIPIEFQSAGVYCVNGMIQLKKNGKWGIVSKNFKQIIPFKYEKIQNFKQGLAGVKVEEKWGFIDLLENEIIPFNYEDCRSFNGGMAGVKFKAKWAFVCIPRKQSLFSIIIKILFPSKIRNQIVIEHAINTPTQTALNDAEPAFKLTPRQKQLTEAVQSLKELSEEMTEYLEMKAQEELVPNWQRKSRVAVNEDACIQFLQKYGKGELTDSMRKFAKGEGDTIYDKFNKWLKWSSENNKNFGGKVTQHTIKMFDIDHTTFEYEWDGIEGSWLEVFQYVSDIEFGNYN